jgi:hypothetical protein
MFVAIRGPRLLPQRMTSCRLQQYDCVQPVKQCQAGQVINVNRLPYIVILHTFYMTVQIAPCLSLAHPYGCEDLRIGGTSSCYSIHPCSLLLPLLLLLVKHR